MPAHNAHTPVMLKEILRELVVSCCDSPEILEPAESALDDISLLVSFLVMADFLFAI